MLGNDTDNHTERASLENDVRRSSSLGLLVVDGIDVRIINYELAGPHKDAQIRELIGEFDNHTPPGKFSSSTVTWNSTVPRGAIRYEYHIVSVSR